MSYTDISDALRDWILAIARQADVHSVSCPFHDYALWEGLLAEQLKRARQSGRPPDDAYFLCGPDSGITGVAKQWPGMDETPEEYWYTGNTLEEKTGGAIHIPYEGVCGADFFIYPTWRKLYPAAWQQENAELDSAVPMKSCNYLLLNFDAGEPACATRTGPIDGWWLYSSHAPYKDCNPFHRKKS